MSKLSALAWGIAFVGFGAAALLNEFNVTRIDAEFVLYFLIPSFVFILVCGIRDSIQGGSLDLPNQSSESTPSSGTSPAGQEPRLP